MIDTKEKKRFLPVEQSHYHRWLALYVYIDDGCVYVLHLITIHWKSSCIHSQFVWTKGRNCTELIHFSLLNGVWKNIKKSHHLHSRKTNNKTKKQLLNGKTFSPVFDSSNYETFIINKGSLIKIFKNSRMLHWKKTFVY